MPKRDLEWQRYHIELPDGGPQYAETDPTQLIVEPWNALSSLFFLIPAIIWSVRISKSVRKYAFIAYCIPLLILGGLGSTFFHGFRSSPFLLLMDVLPITILTLSVSVYFWQKVLKNWWITSTFMAMMVLVRILLFRSNYFSPHTAINISYALTGIIIFLPITIMLFRSDFQKWKVILISILLFGLALYFREIDARSFQILPMGTHFLWHIFSAAGSYFLAEYLY